MGYANKIKIKDQIDLLDKYDIEYVCWNVALKSLHDSGKIKEMVEYLNNNTKCKRICFVRSGSTRYTPLSIKKDLESNASILKEIMFNALNISLNPKVSFHDKEEHDIELKKTYDKLKVLLEQNNSKKLVLCPPNSFELINRLTSPNNKVKKTNSVTLGGELKGIAVGGILTARDYLNAMGSEEYKYLIIPRNSFDINFDDFSMTNINFLFKRSFN